MPFPGLRAGAGNCSRELALVLFPEARESHSGNGYDQVSADLTFLPTGSGWLQPGGCHEKYWGSPWGAGLP